MTRPEYIKSIRAISTALAPAGIFPLIFLSRVIPLVDFTDAFEVSTLCIIGGAGALLILYAFFGAPWLLWKRFGEAALDAFAVQAALAAALPIFMLLKPLGLHGASVFALLAFYILLRAWLRVVLE